jgi:catechol 2,3-dioxygenase-like lactoylglutathione lyase family enzyme
MDAAAEFAFHHVGISVPDLEAAAQWWEQMFGFKVVNRLRRQTSSCWQKAI